MFDIQYKTGFFEGDYSMNKEFSDMKPAAEKKSSGRPVVQGFFEPRTFSVQYVVSDPATQLCAIIDPVLDYDEKSGSTATNSADAILDYVRENGLTVAWILDTHPHADHFSAATYLKKITGAPTAIGDHVVEVQRLWKNLYNLPENFPTDGSQWDHLFADGESFQLGRTRRKGGVLARSYPGFDHLCHR